MKKVWFLFLTLFAFVGIVNAEEVDCIGKIEGVNYYGNPLAFSITCSNVTMAARENVKWYYNDTNSTEGGTEITSARGRLVIDTTKDLVGKYIYVESTLTHAGYESKDIKVITTSSNNVSATVGDYIKVIDNNNYKITTKVQNGSVNMTVSNTDDEDANYQVIFTNSDTTPTLTQQPVKGCDSNINDDFTKGSKYIKDGVVVDIDDWYLVKGYNKAYVIKYYSSNGGMHCEITKNPIELKKPELGNLKGRYKIGQMDINFNRFFVQPQFPYLGETGSHILETKVGKVTNGDIINDVKNGKYDSLLNYAKNHDGYKQEMSDGSFLDVSKTKFDKGSFYYIYVKYKTDDGLYRDIEGVELTIADGYSITEVIDWNTAALPTATTEEKTNNPTTETSKTDNTKKEEIKNEVVKTYEFEIKYESNGGEGTMKSQTGKSGQAIVLAKNEFKYEKPKKHVFWGWNLYLEDANGKREAIKDEKGKIIRFEEGSKVENLKVLSGYKLVAVAEWTPATGMLEIGAISILLLGLGVLFYLTKKKNKVYEV